MRRGGEAPPRSSRTSSRQRPFRTRSQEAYVALLRTAADSKRFLSHKLDAEDVTLQQYNVLRILRGAGDGGLPTLSVAERMVERTPGVTRLIDRMERKGWVTRERCSERPEAGLVHDHGSGPESAGSSGRLAIDAVDEALSQRP